MHRPGVPFPQERLQCLRLRAGVQQQRRAGGLPDAAVGGRGAARPEAQDEPVQDAAPYQGRHLDDPGIGQELRQVAAYRGGFGGLRRTQVDEQHAGRGRAGVIEVRGAEVFHDRWNAGRGPRHGCTPHIMIC